MSGDIEDFLRRAAQRRAQRLQTPQQPTPRRQASPPPQILDAEVVPDGQAARPQVLRGASVSEHVSEHIQAGVFDQEIAKLGQEVDREDEQMDAHLHNVFEHSLGQLGSKTAAAAESTLDDDAQPPSGQPTTQAAQLLALLSSPASVRQAIILSEILQRPEDRW